MPGEDEAVRDLKRALREQHQQTGNGDDSPSQPSGPRGLMRGSSSLPSLADPPLHPDIGRPRDIAQPGGFRRDHILRSGSSQGSAAAARRPLLGHAPLLDSLLDPRLRHCFSTSDGRHGSVLSSGIADASAVGPGEDEAAAAAAGRRTRGSSDLATALLILKSTVGGTLIVIPGAFKDAGLLSASLVLVAIGGIEIYCMVLLVHCNRAIGGGSYGDVARRTLGPLGAWAVDGSLILSQLGFVCAEMLYVAKNGNGALHGVLGQSHSRSRSVLTEDEILILQMLLTVPMAWIRHLKYFKFSNIIANGTVLGALGVLLGISVRSLGESGPAPDVDMLGRNWLLFAGTSVFSFECINFVIPMYEAHENKSTFVPVLTGTLWCVVVLFIAFGAVNYLCYGAATRPVVTLNLPASSAAGKVIPFAFAFASLLNVPLFLFPASITIESKLFGETPQGLARKWKKNSLRVVLVLFCTFLAWVGAKKIEAMVSVIGSFCCVPLAFVYPAICHLRLCKPGPAVAALDCLIATLGAFLFVMTTATALREF